METAFAVVRAVHIAAAIALLGGFVFAAWIDARPPAQRDGAAALDPALARSTAGALAVAVASGLAWLALQAATMSGLPIEQALAPDTLAVVLGQTRFGHAWLARAVLCGALALLAMAAPRTRGGSGARLLGLGAMLSATLLATLALVGHAGAGRGAAEAVHLTADALHLLAAGAWLGALWPLAGVLARAHDAAEPARLDAIAQTTRRFSWLGGVSVAALVASGLVNATFTVGTLSALALTSYGQLLLAKIALFGAMLGLAAVNLTRLTPIASDASTDPGVRRAALLRLRRNAGLEAALGAIVLALVGVLGMTMPAAHAPSAMPAMPMR